MLKIKSKNNILARRCSCALSVLGLILMLSGCNAFKPSAQKNFETALGKAPYDAIIVPGYPFEPPSWHRNVKMRVHWANYVYEQGIAKNIIFSGGAVYSPFVEAEIMRAYAIKLGIPEENIFIETRAKHSTENVYYSYKVAQKNGFEKVALATDPFQTNNLHKFLNKYELPIEKLTVVFDTLLKIDRYEPSINYESLRVDSFISIEDTESLLYRLKGTLGKQIIWHEEDLKKPRRVRKMKRQNRLAN